MRIELQHRQPLYGGVGHHGVLAAEHIQHQHEGFLRIVGRRLRVAVRLQLLEARVVGDRLIRPRIHDRVGDGQGAPQVHRRLVPRHREEPKSAGRFVGHKSIHPLSLHRHEGCPWVVDRQSYRVVEEAVVLRGLNEGLGGHEQLPRVALFPSASR